MVKNLELYKKFDAIIPENFGYDELAEIVGKMLKDEYGSLVYPKFMESLKQELLKNYDLTERFNQLIDHNKNIL